MFIFSLITLLYAKNILKTHCLCIQSSFLFMFTPPILFTILLPWPEHNHYRSHMYDLLLVRGLHVKEVWRNVKIVPGVPFVTLGTFRRFLFRIAAFMGCLWVAVIKTLGSEEKIGLYLRGKNNINLPFKDLTFSSVCLNSPWKTIKMC